MTRLTTLLLICIALQRAISQTIPVSENLVTEGIPELSVKISEDVKAYTEYRGAFFEAWHPSKKEMMIATRFGNTLQLHYVKFPGGDRKQVTFYDEAASGATFEPLTGNYFLFNKDIGGNEFDQLYRFDMTSKKVTLLTDGKRSQNGNIAWSKKGDRIAYATTRRNGKDRDVYVMNPLDTTSNKKVFENSGGGWGISDWSPDDSKILLTEYVSINEIRLYLGDVQTGVKTRILPLTDERSTYSPLFFSKDGKGIYLLSNKDNEFTRIAYYDIATKKIIYLTTSIKWDIENADLSKDGNQIVFTSNENGTSKAYILSTATNQFQPLDGLPTAVINGVKWSPDSKSIAIGFGAYNASSDVYVYETVDKKLVRWTESETGGIDVTSLQEPKLIIWKSFDGRDISGYLYKAASKFSSKRPVIISIHGGPEGQSLPGFSGRYNYFLNELGISIIYPNVRGSSGYGKTFVDLDNGMKREESVRDIGALLDWIATQPDLDKDKIMVVGGSYGGYMTLAASYLYSDKISCSIDVVGISNYNTFLKNTESYRRDLRRAEYGDERDPKMAAYFEKIAPLNHTDMIKKPIFIVQGGNDPRVPYTESIQMKDKIKHNGGTVWFLMAKDEGHGFAKKNNSDFQFFATVEFVKTFLLK